MAGKESCDEDHDWVGGATDRVASAAREEFYRAVQKAIDDEASHTPSAGS